MPLQPAELGQGREVGVVGVAVEVDRELLEAPMAEPGGGLDDVVGPLVPVMLSAWTVAAPAPRWMVSAPLLLINTGPSAVIATGLEPSVVTYPGDWVGVRSAAPPETATTENRDAGARFE